MYFDPQHLTPREPTPAMLHREDYLNEKKAATHKAAKLPVAPTFDAHLLRAQIACRVGRFLRFA